MEANEILQNLKKGIFQPIYLLQGEEPYYIDEISNWIEKNALTEAERGFNQTVFYGKDSDAMTIAESSMRFPMMANKQVIIIKEAQTLNKIETLASYAAKPLASTILVINYKYKKLDSRTKLVKSIKKNGVIFTSNKVRDYQLPKWVEGYLKQRDFNITPQAVQILTAYLGTSLSKVANELDKLIIAIKDTNTITPEHIEKNIGLSKDFNIFELQNALGAKNVFKANQIINYFGANEKLNPIQMTTALLYSYFSKIFKFHFLKDKSERSAAVQLGVHPFFVKDYIAAARKYSPTKLYEIIGILREYDMKSKGFGVSTMVEKADLQKEMIYKILH
ncbi:MAG: DNA polymerase III subunit delta [Draconibacterium sp.]|nr:DNA polymerase III subunit delta [Draconibacterium sp.]